MEEFPKSTFPTAADPEKARDGNRFAGKLRITNLLAASIVIPAVFAFLQYSTSAVCCGDFDGYYHIKWSHMLWEGIRTRHLPAFTWLPLTTLNAHDYVDHHLLYHVLLIPFTWFQDLQTGAKVSAIVFASIAVFACYWLIVRYRIRYSLVWLIALLSCSAPFLYRMNMTKAPPLAIIYLVIGFYLLFQRKFWPLLPLSFVFTLTYDMFVLLGVAAFIWTVVIAWTEERLEWRPLVFVAAGVLLGLVINPYFPHNIYLLYEHARIKLKTGDFSTKVGQEWYPYDSFEFIVNCLVALMAMIAGFVAFDSRDRRGAERPLFLLIFATVLMLMTARWKRFAEYFPPFAVLFAAFALQQFWQRPSVFGRLPEDVMDDLQPYLDRTESFATAEKIRRGMLWRHVGAGLVGVALLVPLIANIRATRRDIADSDPRNYYAAGAAWMRGNIPPGEVVFNTDWDDFPRLFYFDPKHVYITGLDPSYLYDRDPSLSEAYDRITTGKVDDPGPQIRDRFGARWVFSDNTDDHFDLIDKALRSGWFDQVYDDNECTILHLRDQKGAPPPEAGHDDSDDDTDSANDNKSP